MYHITSTILLHELPWYSYCSIKLHGFKSSLIVFWVEGGCTVEDIQLKTEIDYHNIIILFCQILLPGVGVGLG